MLTLKMSSMDYLSFSVHFGDVLFLFDDAQQFVVILKKIAVCKKENQEKDDVNCKKKLCVFF